MRRDGREGGGVPCIIELNVCQQRKSKVIEGARSRTSKIGQREAEVSESESENESESAVEGAGG